VFCLLTLAILSVVVGKSRQHDFSLQRQPPLVTSRCRAVGGFGVPRHTQKHHQNSTLSVKMKKGQPVSAEDKADNKALSKQRVFIEHVNRRCKIFRIVKDVYRGKHTHYSLTWNLVAALVNLRYGCI
jgi:hypothetical protein